VNKTRYFRTLLAIVMITSISIISNPVFAMNDAMMDLLKILRDKGSLTNDEYGLLVNASRADTEEVEGKSAKLEAKVEAKVDEKTANLPKITTDGKLKIESGDGQFSFQPIGRIFWDSVWVDDDGNSGERSGSELRRSRLGFEAQFFKHWKAKLEYDFAGSEADIKDGWLSYNNKTAGGNAYNVKVGQQHVPFGFTTISSSKYMPFLRRPMFADGPLSPTRNYGASFRMDNARWLVHAGGFLEAPEDGAVNVDDEGEDETTFAFRVAGTPVMKDGNHLIHVGASYMYKQPHGDGVRIRQRIISHLSDRALEADFGNDVDDIHAFDLEALAVWGPFHALGEYVNWSVDDIGTGNADLSAWSIEAGWFLTGESMKYKEGQFSGISPNRPFMNGGLGAWQLALRFENMDLNDGSIVGGDGDVLTAGINWYPVKNMRFMANYASTLNFTRPGNTLDGVEPSAFSLRSQVYW
jgi:phosphate-selective porin OprO/OprP